MSNKDMFLIKNIINTFFFSLFCPYIIFRLHLEHFSSTFYKHVS